MPQASRLSLSAAVVIGLDVGQHACAVQRACPKAGRRRGARHAEHSRQRLASLGEMVPLLPEPEERRTEPQRPLDVARGDQIPDGGAEIVVLDVAASQPRFAFGRAHLERLFLGEDEHVRGVRALGRRGLAMLEQPLPAVLPERLEHDEARLAVVGRPLDEQAVVDERGDAVQDVDAQVLAGVADGLRRLERAASGEDRQAAKEPSARAVSAGRSST